MKLVIGTHFVQQRYFVRFINEFVTTNFFRCVEQVYIVALRGVFHRVLISETLFRHCTVIWNRVNKPIGFVSSGLSITCRYFTTGKKFAKLDVS